MSSENMYGKKRLKLLISNMKIVKTVYWYKIHFKMLKHIFINTSTFGASIGHDIKGILSWF
jgi:hypothetical protein